MAVPKPVAPPATQQPPVSELVSAMRAPSPASMGAVSYFTMEPAPRFFLLHSPTDWEVVQVSGEVLGHKLEGAYFLPVLTKLLEVPGSSPGMRTRRRDESEDKSFADALDYRRRAGWAVLDRSQTIASAFLPAGMPEGPYIREVSVRSPSTGAAGVAYVEAWQVPLRTAPGRAQAFRYDHASNALWRASLCLSGVIAAPTEDVIAPLVRGYKARVRRIGTLTQLSEKQRELRESEAIAALKSAEAAAVLGAA